MKLFFLLLFSSIIGQRLVELYIARRNEQWLKAHGGIEKGKEHYKWFIILHSLFFIAIIIEVLYRGVNTLTFNSFLFSIFLLIQLARVWCIQSLGRFWNTKIIVLPNVALVRRGPYKYIKHPNYIIVGIELFIIPLLFGAYYSAIIFPIFHLILMWVRIPEEEKALRGVK